MITAIVKWFDNDKGMGFAKPISESVIDTEHEDIFLHHSNIEKKSEKNNDFVVLHTGELVKCIVVKTDKGLKGVDIKLVRHQLND